MTTDWENLCDCRDPWNAHDGFIWDKNSEKHYPQEEREWQT